MPWDQSDGKKHKTKAAQEGILIDRPYSPFPIPPESIPEVQSNLYKCILS